MRARSSAAQKRWSSGERAWQRGSQPLHPADITLIGAVGRVSRAALLTCPMCSRRARRIYFANISIARRLPPMLGLSNDSQKSGSFPICYQFGELDLFSRFVVGWAVSAVNDTYVALPPAGPDMRDATRSPG